MIDPGDAHEWLMFQARDIRTEYQYSVAATSSSVSQCANAPTQKRRKLSAKDWQAATKPVGVGKELYAEQRRKRRKSHWSIRVQKRLNALIKGREDAIRKGGARVHLI